MKYKVGDIVIVDKDLVEDECYGAYPFFIDGNERDPRGKSVTIVRVDNSSYDVNCDGNLFALLTDEMLESPVKTLDNLEVGDILIDENGNERTILATCEKVHFLSAYGNKGFAGRMYTALEIKEMNLTIKQEVPVEEVTELTLEEIAEKFGKDVTKIKIKK